MLKKENIKAIKYLLLKPFASNKEVKEIRTRIGKRSITTILWDKINKEPEIVNANKYNNFFLDDSSFRKQENKKRTRGKMA